MLGEGDHDQNLIDIKTGEIIEFVNDDLSIYSKESCIKIWI